MALAIDASTPAIAVQSNGATAALTTASFTPPSGSTLLVLYSANTVDPTSPGVPTITDSLGAHLTYTLTNHSIRSDTPSADGQAAAWTAPVSSSAAMTITVTNQAASGGRHAAISVQVITGAHATPAPVHGESGSTSTGTVNQSYTANATGGQGFTAIADWNATGVMTAGTGTTRIGSAAVGAPDYDYGFFRRTSADDVSGNSNSVNATLGGTSNSVRWIWVEIVPAAGTDATATPATVAAIGLIGSIQASSTAAPATVAAIGSVGSATVQAGTGVAPATVVAVGAIGSPTVQAGSRPVPATVVAVGLIGTPAVQAGSVVVAATVQAVAAVATPTVTAGGNVTVSAVTVAAIGAVGTPAVQAGSRPAPATLPAIGLVGSVSVQAGTTAAPATVAAIASVGSPSLRTGSTISAATVAAIAAIGAPVVGGVLPVPGTITPTTRAGSSTSSTSASGLLTLTSAGGDA